MSKEEYKSGLMKPRKVHRESPEYKGTAMIHRGKTFTIAPIDEQIYKYKGEKPIDEYAEIITDWSDFFEDKTEEPYLFDKDTEQRMFIETLRKDRFLILKCTPAFRWLEGDAWYVGTLDEDNEETKYISRWVNKDYPQSMYIIKKLIRYERDIYKEWRCDFEHNPYDPQFEDDTPVFGHVTDFIGRTHALSKKCFKYKPFLIIQRMEHLRFMEATVNEWWTNL